MLNPDLIHAICTQSFVGLICSLKNSQVLCVLNSGSTFNDPGNSIMAANAKYNMVCPLVITDTYQRT